MNKKASVNVTLLVFLALFVAIFALYSFAVHSKVDTSIYDPRILQKSYILEEKYSSELFIKGYNQLAQDYWTQTRNYKLNSNFKISPFSILIYDQLRDVSSNIQGDIVSFDAGEIILSDTITEDEKALLDQTYTFRLKNELNMTKLGLHSFDKIDSIIISCNNNIDLSVIKSCIENELVNFEVDVLEGRKVFLKTKKEFKIDGQIRKIDFNFIF